MHEDVRAWLDEFHRLAALDSEELRDEDFPRMRFERAPIDLLEGE